MLYYIGNNQGMGRSKDDRQDTWKSASRGKAYLYSPSEITALQELVDKDPILTVEELIATILDVLTEEFTQLYTILWNIESSQR